jgi:hypothetical protein
MTENKGDLISREALKETIIKICGKCSNNITEYDENHIPNGNCAIWHILHMIDNAPTSEPICPYLSDNEVKQPCIKAPCERPQGEQIAWEQGYEFSKNEKRPQCEWIPVSERLPDKNMPCLVSVGKFNFIQIAMYSDLMETIDHKIFYQGDYGKNNFQNITEYVNAWQPLPEPYKADMRGDEE